MTGLRPPPEVRRDRERGWVYLNDAWMRVEDLGEYYSAGLGIVRPRRPRDVNLSAPSKEV